MQPIRHVVGMIRVQDTKSENESIRHTAKQVVSIEHSLWKCERCQADCWIGPKQKLVVTLQGAEAVCYFCVLNDESITAQGRLPILSLDPNADDKPRRFPST